MQTIIKILSVRDTRQYEEGPDDNWIPIPGSGDENQCARCGRLHEIHAEVELSDGNVAIVGTGCMNAESLEIQSRIKSMTSAAKTLARNRAQLAAIRKEQERYDAAVKAVDSMPIPTLTIKPRILTVGRDAGKPDGLLFEIGDGYAILHHSAEISEERHAERKACALDGWKRNRIREIYGNGMRPYSYHLEKSIAKLEKKLGI